MADDEKTENNGDAPNSTAMWSQDGGGGAETGIVDGGEETEIVDSAPRQIETPSAWSEAEDYPELPAHRSWRGTAVRAGAILAAAIVVAGGVWTWDHLHQAPRPAPAPAANGPVLDGIYEIASDNQQRTVNGLSNPGMDVTRYWAFRSLCTPTRCVATAAEVSDTNHQVANYDHDHSAWLWSYGRWVEDPDHNTTPCTQGPNPKFATATMARTLAPQPDGTLKGTEIDVVDSDSPCGAGVVLKHPISAKRIGDTPKDVVADPATAPPDIGAHANQYVAIAFSPGARVKTPYPGSGDTADYANKIALSECRGRSGANDCVVVETNLNGCVSLAVDANGAYAGGEGPDQESAKRDARAKLPSSYWASDGVCSS